MHNAALSRFRLALLGSLAPIAIFSASATEAAPNDQAAPTPTQSVRIDSFAFGPAEVSIPVGTTLAWSNAQTGVPHTTSSGDGVWDSGILSTGDTFNFEFDQAGDFAYQCNIHPSMHGIVHVLADAGTQASVGATTDAAAAAAPQASTAPASQTTDAQGSQASPVPAVPTQSSAPMLTPVAIATPVPAVVPPPSAPTTTPAHYGY